MPTIADSAVCIRRWDFSETSQTVSLFAREHGVIRGLAKGAKRERGAFSGGFDPLTRGHLVAIVKPGRDLATLTQWTLQEIFRAVRSDLRANRAGLYMADLIHHMMSEADPHPGLFDALVAALSRLSCPEKISATLLEFQWTLLREAGFRPDVGESLIPHPATFEPHWRIRPETAALLQRIDAGEGAGDAANADPATIDRANRLLADYVREVLGNEPPTMAWAFRG